MLSQQLAQQLQKVLQLSNRDELDAALLALSDPQSAQHEHVCACFSAGMSQFLSDIDQSFLQYQNAFKQQLEAKNAAQEKMLLQLRSSINQLLQDNKLPALNDQAHDLLSLTELMASLVAQKKKAQKALDESDSRMRSLVANLPGCVYSIQPDNDWTVQILSGGIFDLTGYQSHELIGRDKRGIRDIILLEDLIGIEEQIRHARETHSPFQLEYRILRRDGHICWVIDRGQCQFDEAGKALSIEGVILDNSAAHEYQQALQDAKEAAEAANRAKDMFLANVSHEMRTPMNGIIGMSELILNTPLNEEQREFLSLVKSSANSLLGIINDLLDFTHIETGHTKLFPVPFILHDLLLDIMQPLALRANQKGLQLSLSIDPHVSKTLVADPVRLRQVLVNLTNNAIKFTNTGSVDVSISYPNPSEIEFKIKDTGIGIPLDRQTAIFEPFIQADSSTTREYGGTGLGLSISKNLIEMMEGRLKLKSAQGKGSTFYFRLPVAPSDEGEALQRTWAPTAAQPTQIQSTDPLISHGTGYRILLAEDNPVNQKVAQRLLALHGHRAVIASNGLEVEEKLAKEPFDLILMDIQMPFRDGIMCTHRIREQEAINGGHIPIIALTAHASEEDRAKCLAAGMDGFASKPFEWNALMAAIEQVTKGIAPQVQHNHASKADLASTQALNDADIFDPTESLIMLNNDAELLSDLALLFLDDAPQRYAEIIAAAEAQQSEQLRHTAHSLKGSLGAVGALRVMKTTQALENAAKTDNWEAITTALSTFKAEYAALYRILSETYRSQN